MTSDAKKLLNCRKYDAFVDIMIGVFTMLIAGVAICELRGIFKIPLEHLPIALGFSDLPPQDSSVVYIMMLIIAYGALWGMHLFNCAITEWDEINAKLEDMDADKRQRVADMWPDLEDDSS